MLAPPVARLQADLLGPSVTDVLLSVDGLAAAALALHGAHEGVHGDLHYGVAAGTAGQRMMSSLLARTVIAYLIVFAVPMLLPVAFFKLVGLGGLRELVTYEAKDTPLHKLDPRLKVLYPIAMGDAQHHSELGLHADRLRAQPPAVDLAPPVPRQGPGSHGDGRRPGADWLLVPGPVLPAEPAGPFPLPVPVDNLLARLAGHH